MDDEKCGAPMGGIWVPSAKGTKHYFELHCNLDRRHGYSRTPEDGHAYIDHNSGMMIVGASIPGAIFVDDRGSVTFPIEDPRASR